MKKYPNGYLREDRGGLVWGRLVSGTLIRRYKRFLADVRLGNGHVVTAHTPNTGSMLGCSEPGRMVHLSRHNDPKRKLKYTLEIIEMPSSLVGVNTGVPNRLVMAAAMQGCIPGLSGYEEARAEVKTASRTRLDLVLKAAERRTCFVEIKNCTLVRDGTAFFPDARTARGKKHLEELVRLAAEGHRAVIFFLVQRTDAIRFSPADHIDPEYGRALRLALRSGVEALACDVRINTERIDVHQELPLAVTGLNPVGEDG